MTERTLAKTAELDIRAQQLYFDGVALPWFIEKNSIEVTTADDDMISVRVTILVDEKLVIVDS